MKILSKQSLARGNWLALDALRWIGPQGDERTWEVCSRINSKGAVMMVPILRPENKLILIRQFRPPTGGWVYEFPAGLVNPGETPEETAMRELREETGYIGEIESVSPPLYTSPGLSSEYIHIVKMTVDSAKQHELRTEFDDSEQIETFLVAPEELADFLARVNAAGDHVDAKIHMWLLASAEK